MVESYINTSLYSSEGADNIIHNFSLCKIMKRGKTVYCECSIIFAAIDSSYLISKLVRAIIILELLATGMN